MTITFFLDTSNDTEIVVTIMSRYNLIVSYVFSSIVLVAVIDNCTEALRLLFLILLSHLFHFWLHFVVLWYSVISILFSCCLNVIFFFQLRLVFLEDSHVSFVLHESMKSNWPTSLKKFDLSSWNC